VVERPTPWREELTEKLGAFRPVVIAAVYDELRRLEGQQGRVSKYAGLVKSMIGDGHFGPEDRDHEDAAGDTAGTNVDDELVSTALSTGAAVATLDGELIASLRANKVPVVSLRAGRVVLV
jgi:rRNA-processing protein FCF1